MKKKMRRERREEHREKITGSEKDVMSAKGFGQYRKCRRKKNRQMKSDKNVKLRHLEKVYYAN